MSPDIVSDSELFGLLAGERRCVRRQSATGEIVCHSPEGADDWNRVTRFLAAFCKDLGWLHSCRQGLLVISSRVKVN